jgi:cytochrome c oxidase cbb3-type subunit 3
MSDENDIPLTEHQYDGIQEFDNPLPNWWLWTFLLAIIFSFHYWIHYELGGGPGQNEELKADLAQIETLKKNSPQPSDKEEELALLLNSDQAISEGRAVFSSKCAACHGPQLQGLIGPNLTDEYWIHGQGKLTDIVGVIRKGVLDKGMPPWEGLLKEGEVKAVAAFIKKQSGTNPPNPKSPQGEKIVGN